MLDPAARPRANAEGNVMNARPWTWFVHLLGRPPRRACRMAKGAWRGPAAIVLAALLAVGCSTLPQRVERPASWSVPDVDGTPLTSLVDASTPPQERHQSGFRLLADGGDALATRLALIRSARVSLDLQYFLIEADASGDLLLHELQAAAQRGVRVRLLLDDLYAGVHDARLAALDRHALVQVRLFNPLPVRGISPAWRVLGSLHEFDRINRRMHNKLFIADGRIALAGGRNIGDDYFMRGQVANFIDLDILATGAVVDELARLFDRFWNDELAYPIGSLVREGGVVAQGGATQRAAEEPLAGADSTAAQIARGWLELRFAPALVFADSPAKVSSAAAPSQPGEAMAQSLALMRGARSDVTIASPYFVPGPTGLALLHEASARGIDIAVMTNSLGATDAPLAYRGYRRYRMAMLKMGVKLAELSPAPAQPQPEHGLLSSAVGRLHAKFAVVDRRWLLVGSLNMDRRSSRLNTELALAIDSPALAGEAADLLQRLWARSNYQLRLSPAEDRIEWVARDGEQLVVHELEPNVDWLGQWRLRLLSLMVSEDLL
jgi:putative cardiolipin synthase